MYVCTLAGDRHGRTLGIYNRLIEYNLDEIIFTALVEIFINIHTTMLRCNVYTEYKVDIVEKDG